MFFTVLNNNPKAGRVPAFFFNYLFFAVVIFIFSCSSNEETAQGKVIAEVYGYKLYSSELQEAMPEGLNADDSLDFVKDYIDTWIKENILLHHAGEELSGKTEMIDQRLEKYKRSLMIYELEKIWVEKELDTLISEKEMRDYFEKNKHDFELKDFILKCVYVKLEKGTPGEDKVLKWIRSDKKEDWLKMDEFCRSSAVSHYHDRDNWIFLNDILRDVPMEIPNRVSFLKSNKFIHFSDDEFTYILYILDYRLKEEASPFSMEKENIRSRILQLRMNTLLKEKRNKLVKNAYENDEIEISEN